VRPLPADLPHHGDADLVPGLGDLAVNVRSGGTRAHLLRRLARVAEASVGGVRVAPGAAASFALLDTRVADIRARLPGHGFAVRRGETFPGLGPGWIRVAVRDAGTSDWFTEALAVALGT
jgi:histidinol-phosphate aminotransferase